MTQKKEKNDNAEERDKDFCRNVPESRGSRAQVEGPAFHWSAANSLTETGGKPDSIFQK